MLKTKARPKIYVHSRYPMLSRCLENELERRLYYSNFLKHLGIIQVFYLDIFSKEFYRTRLASTDKQDLRNSFYLLDGAINYLEAGQKLKLISCDTNLSSCSLLETLSNAISSMHLNLSFVPSIEPEEISFTKREMAILLSISRGFSNKEISRDLNISINTVKRHVQNMLEKSGARNRLELFVKFERLKLFSNLPVTFVESVGWPKEA